MKKKILLLFLCTAVIYSLLYFSQSLEMEEGTFLYLYSEESWRGSEKYEEMTIYILEITKRGGEITATLGVKSLETDYKKGPSINIKKVELEVRPTFNGMNILWPEKRVVMTKKGGFKFGEDGFVVHEEYKREFEVVFEENELHVKEKGARSDKNFILNEYTTASYFALNEQMEEKMKRHAEAFEKNKNHK